MNVPAWHLFIFEMLKELTGTGTDTGTGTGTGWSEV